MSIAPNELKTAIIMCKRATCSGEESLAVAVTIQALEAEYKALVEPTPPKKDDAEKPKAPKSPPKPKRKPRGK